MLEVCKHKPLPSESQGSGLWMDFFAFNQSDHSHVLGALLAWSRGFCRGGVLGVRFPCLVRVTAGRGCRYALHPLLTHGLLMDQSTFYQTLSTELPFV